jgi:hypothetical protein
MTTLRNTLLFTLTIAALALVVAVPVAMANTISYTTYIASTPTDFTNLALSPSVSKFNTSLGTLNSVTVKLNVSGSAATSVSEKSGTKGTFKVNESSKVTLGSTNSSLNTALNSLNETVTYSSAITTLWNPADPVSPFYPASYNFGTVSLTGTAPTETINPTYFSLFEGAGTLILDASSVSGYSFQGGGNNQTATISNDDSGSVIVTYDYTPGNPPVVPEPGTLTLFGTGLLGLAGALRYKFMKSR